MIIMYNFSSASLMIPNHNFLACTDWLFSFWKLWQWIPTVGLGAIFEIFSGEVVFKLNKWNVGHTTLIRRRIPQFRRRTYCFTAVVKSAVFLQTSWLECLLGSWSIALAIPHNIMLCRSSIINRRFSIRTVIFLPLSEFSKHHPVCFIYAAGQ